MVYAFWEGPMPAYIQMCLETWKFPYTLLNYENLPEYTDLQVTDKLKQFTLPQIADVVRVHVLRDQGGYWLDTDTISITGKLPEETIAGNPDTRTNTIGFLHTDKGSEMFRCWAEYQDSVIANPHPSTCWNTVGNAFTDRWVKEHSEVSITPIENKWAETYFIDKAVSRYEKYQQFYFKESHDLQELRPTDLLMLHNSWTPTWYKKLSEAEVLEQNCTLSNILKEVL